MNIKQLKIKFEETGGKILENQDRTNEENGKTAAFEKESLFKKPFIILGL